MKITVCKEYTTLSQLPQVKADISEFKARYTDGDLKTFFCDATGNNSMCCADIVSVNVEAFPGGTDYNNETHFSVTVLCRSWHRFIEAHFYCDMELQINTGDLLDYRGISTGKKMYSVDVYELVR